jgi:hypothetical protein
MVSCGHLHFSVLTGQSSLLEINSRLLNKDNNGRILTSIKESTKSEI